MIIYTWVLKLPRIFKRPHRDDLVVSFVFISKLAMKRLFSNYLVKDENGREFTLDRNPN